MTDTAEKTETTIAVDFDQVKVVVEKAVFATVGAGVVAGRKIAGIDFSGKVEELKGFDYKAKADEYGAKAKESFDSAYGEWTKVGEETVGDIRTKVDVEDITTKVGERVHVDQWAEQADKLRGQLDDLVANWRTNFTPEGEAVETVAAAAKDVAETAKTAASEVSESAKTAASSVSETAKATVTELTTDDLTVIDGVGPTYAKRLVEAGIDTFKALAKADVEQVAETAKVSTKAAEGWIAEAKKA